ncbi:leucine-rich repeat-containing protein 74A-like [Embiotoca jacksoni]|uniref:leucine-rich repeat-containing protein 74A-like n=1 Tax=Embiotoca jacksoni TaxID=100190 RepID=UPI0037037764
MEVEKATQTLEDDSIDQWDTDLEEKEDSRLSFSGAELYLLACQQIGTVPISSFLRHSDEPTLNLNSYGVGPLGAKALAIALKDDIVVTQLELENNGLQQQGTRYLMNMLKDNITIQSLNLSFNRLGLEGAKIMSEMLPYSYYVKSFKLAGNHFDDSAVKYLTDALKDDEVVKALDLSDNNIREAGGEHLCHMLARNDCMEVLNLSWNLLRMRGAVALSAGLKVNSALKQLWLSNNNLGQKEAESLGQALKLNRTLVLLDLTGNNIDDQAVTLLCQGLAINDTLRVLKLARNPTTNIGALKLLETVKRNTNSAIEEIDITMTFVYETFLELLEEVRKTRPALKVQFDVMRFVHRDVDALRLFKKFLEEQNKSIIDFFADLDQEKTMKVSTSAFRSALKEGNAPLDQRQVHWLVTKFDKKCTSSINLRQFAELS